MESLLTSRQGETGTGSKPTRVAYVVSSFPVSFVVNEIESHRLAGWEILPLSGSRPRPGSALSTTAAYWSRQSIYRPSPLIQLERLLVWMARRPQGIVAIFRFLLRLALADPKEFAKALYELGAACYFADAVQEFRADHIHAHFASRSLSLAIMIGSLTGCSVSCTAHAFDIFTRSSRSLKLRLELCRFVACISEFNIRYLHQVCGRHIAERCHLVRCGIDLQEFASASRNPVPGRILFVGNLIEKKGLDLALRACARLKRTDVDFEFHVVGEGPQRRNLERHASSLGIGSKVKFLGAMPNDRIPAILAPACIFLMPCKHGPSGDMDGIPVAMMEAMGCQVPPLSTPISGIPELVEHGVSGILVEEGDEEGLAASLTELIRDPDLARRLGRAAREKVERDFDAGLNAAKLRALIETCRTVGGCGRIDPNASQRQSSGLKTC